jgi:hypothetical protein
MPLNKISNEYAQALGRFYSSTPKAVFAAIAFSFAERLFAKSATTKNIDCLLEEWKILHENGFIPQKPPAKVRP